MENYFVIFVGITYFLKNKIYFPIDNLLSYEVALCLFWFNQLIQNGLELAIETVNALRAKTTFSRVKVG